MKIMVVGASRGLGRAFVEGLCVSGDTVIGVSRTRPNNFIIPDNVELKWIEADMSHPLEAAKHIEKETPDQLDVVIYNLGIWESTAFTDEYLFLDDPDDCIAELVNTNITGAILLIKRLLPKLLKSKRPQLILTGSTSGLRQNGSPEVTFGASKFALTGIAEALRENFRNNGLAVTTLQLGYLNTEDNLSTPRSTAAERGDGTLIPVHDVVSIVSALINMSCASYVREIVLPAIADDRF